MMPQFTSKFVELSDERISALTLKYLTEDFTQSQVSHSCPACVFNALIRIKEKLLPSSKSVKRWIL
jgi:hypothetical protein